MKAKDIFEQHREGFVYGDDGETPRKVLLHFIDEMKTLCEVRHAQKDAACVAIIRELNQKWNALAKIVEKEACPYLLKKDGFVGYMCENFKTYLGIDLSRLGAVK